MMGLFKSKIFQRQFFTMFALIVVLLATTMIVVSMGTHDAIEEQQLKVVESYRDEVVENLTVWAQNRLIDVQTQALYLEKLNPETYESTQIKDLIKNKTSMDSNLYEMIIVDKDGNPINSTDGPLSGINVSDRDYFQSAMKGIPYVTNVFLERKNNVLTIGFSSPIYVKEEVEYVIAGFVTLSRINEVINNMNMEEFGYLYLINEEAQLIAKTENVEGYSIVSDDLESVPLTHKDHIEALLLKNEGTGSYLGLNEDIVYGSYEWIDVMNVGVVLEFKEEAVMKPLNDLVFFMTGIGLIVILVGSVITFLISKRIVLPISQLITATGRITEKNYDSAISLRTNTELDVLIENFNVMQTAIVSREDALESKNVELKAQRLEAIEANVLKSQFLANMSHELRTPLNSIIGFTNRIIKKSADVLPEVQLENLSIVLKEGYHLLDLINNLLDYSKIEAGKMDIHVDSFDLAEVIAEVSTLINSVADEKALSYKQKLFNESLPINSDRMKIKQILLNLLSNAIKYSETGTIEISVEQDDETYVIQVKDEGIGISDEHIDNIFDEFRQVDGTYTRKVGGTGLGLAITRRFVEMLGGKISVTSAEGKGSCFEVRLPITIVVSAVTDDKRIVQTINSNKACVVSIDDDPNIHRLFREYFSDSEYELVSLNGYEEIMLEIIKLNPALILLDIMLPNKDGWDILTELKQNPLTKTIPVVMVSALNEKKLAYNMKADGYLVKPVTQEELMGSIGSILKESKPEKVLIVDDDEKFLRLLAEIFSDEGIDYKLAKDGIQALKMIELNLPDIVLLDIMMPGLDGFEVIHEIKNRSNWNDMTVIVMTSKYLSEQERIELRKRAANVIEKSGEHLEVIIESIISNIKEI